MKLARESSPVHCPEGGREAKVWLIAGARVVNGSGYRGPPPSRGRVGWGVAQEGLHPSRELTSDPSQRPPAGSWPTHLPRKGGGSDFVSSPAAGPPFGQAGALRSEGRVVAVARVHPRLVRQPLEHLR